MIKALMFDLDGVLTDSIKDIHYKALNKAIFTVFGDYCISYEDHIKKYDGLPTKIKLGKLAKEKRIWIDEFQINSINDLKQKFTIELLENEIKPRPDLIETFEKLEKDDYILTCCSNSVKNTISVTLSKLGIKHTINKIYSNEDVDYSKPNPQIYLKAMVDFGLRPDETLIFEDSPKGVEAAKSSGAHVKIVKNSNEITYENIIEEISKIEKKPNCNIKYKNDKLNIVIPMAGLGSRFEQAGYSFPKPLIDIHGKTMIHAVVESLNIEANYTFICQRSHYEKYNLGHLLKLIAGENTKVIQIDGLTEGAACTILKTAEFIDNDNPLLIANGDQIIKWNPVEFFYKMNCYDWDAGILTFKSNHPKWSYTKLNNDGLVSEIAEKKVISDLATAGVYVYKHGKDLVKYIGQMISKNIRTNNEFYLAPSFNEFVLDNKRIGVYSVEEMWGVGTPEDLNEYLKNIGN